MILKPSLSDLVGNPDDRLSHEASHLLHNSLVGKMTLSMTSMLNIYKWNVHLHENVDTKQPV